MCLKLLNTLTNEQPKTQPVFMPPVPPPPPTQKPSPPQKPGPKLLLHPDLLRYYGPGGPPKDTPIQDQIRMLAMRQAMVMSGAKRSADNLPAGSGGKLVSLNNPAQPQSDPQVKWTVDPIAQDQVITYLKEAFEYGTPKDGAIFWTGIDANKLVKRVDEWNEDTINASRQAGIVPRQAYGQLEATTDARFVNKAFTWDQASQKYWNAVSRNMAMELWATLQPHNSSDLRKAVSFCPPNFPPF